VRRRASRSRDAIALALSIAVIAIAAEARAQPCCAGGTALTPGRLNLHENGLVGLGVRVTGITGSFDPSGKFAASPSGAVEVDLEQDLIATLRVLRRGQFTVVAPITQTYRRVPGAADFGGGFGDLQMTARFDATEAGVSVYIPGIAVLAGLTLPTGVPPEAASQKLATDATGTGVIQGTAGLAVEQTFGNFIVNLTGSATVRSARVVEGIHTRLGPSFGVSGAVGYSFDAGPVAAITIAYTAQLATRNDGVAVADSGRAGLRAGISGGYAWSDWWRAQGGFFVDPPVPHFGRNQPAGAGFSATLIRSW
jgi:hypothetical protein